ncbi:DNA-directed RNA polymerase, subunit E'' [Candidatus Methanoperedens nitroreducens]|uniref:Transcription elongation factor Spt4 n=1 Tax=Candidatus Methanoperedens nitratireducens TaxID=1392998 RepID=A0A062UVA4_9EURY|nr:transcription elongation factor subunit Spt4 [Candidatus Methanoperedens nitroreducens]KCZ70926.1 DNA-directed RNA polymerase, subunit E'' [Candidatus Methanoperedens nitroreducens]MDJ1421707.1 transcription elongation factor subunit Spt4 [Candidatus Methanoperedens sp.]
MAELVCKECHRVISGQVCEGCSSTALTSDWSGYVVIIDPQRSQIAKKLGVKLPGKYALKVR